MTATKMFIAKYIVQRPNMDCCQNNAAMYTLYIESENMNQRNVARDDKIHFKLCRRGLYCLHIM